MRRASTRTALIVVVPAVALGLVGCSGQTTSTVARMITVPQGKPAAGGSANAGKACSAKHFRLESTEVATRKAKHLVARMTLSQEVDLMDGAGLDGGTAGTVG